MNRKIYIPVVLAVFVIVSITKADATYWETIKQFIIAYDKAKGISENDRVSKKFDEYLNSLTAEQLIEAGRQCSKELNDSFHKHGFSEGTGFVMGFFFFQYPKTAGLENLQPIFKEIEDTNQTDMWRSFLIHIFRDGWSQDLSDISLRDIANNIDKILARKDVYYLITYESLYTTKAVLQEMENRNAKQTFLTNDPNRGRHDNRMAHVNEYYTRFSQRLLSISNEPNLEPQLQQASIAILSDMLDKPVGTKSQIKERLITALRNYDKYNERTWKLLLRVGKEQLNLPESTQISKDMIAKMKAKIDNEPDKGKKIRLDGELQGIKHYAGTID